MSEPQNQHKSNSKTKVSKSTLSNERAGYLDLIVVIFLAILALDLLFLSLL